MAVLLRSLLAADCRRLSRILKTHSAIVSQPVSSFDMLKSYVSSFSFACNEKVHLCIHPSIYSCKYLSLRAKELLFFLCHQLRYNANENVGLMFLALVIYCIYFYTSALSLVPQLRVANNDDNQR